MTEDEVRLIAEKVVKNALSKSNSLTQLAAAGSELVDQSSAHLEKSMDALEASTSHYLNSIRQSRVAAVSEINAILAPLKEIRQFFLGSDHSAEIARLREFIELCERLKKLKDDGTLDAVSDSILKLC